MPQGFWHPKLKHARTPLADRLWAKVEKTDSCWLWLGHLSPLMGYGKISVRRDDPISGGLRSMMTHRAAWVLTHGTIPAGLQVCHRCDVPRCVNPAHLFLGTAKDNNDDKIAKGRMRGGKREGEAHRNAKLSADQVRDIYRRSHSGEGQSKLAAEFSIHQCVISRIHSGKRWRSVTAAL